MSSLIGLTCLREPWDINKKELVADDLDSYTLRNVHTVLRVLSQVEGAIGSSAVGEVRVCLRERGESATLAESAEAQRVNHTALVALRADKFTHGCPDFDT